MKRYNNDFLINFLLDEVHLAENDLVPETAFMLKNCAERIAELQDDLEDARRAISSLQNIALETLEYWDNDNDPKVGKMLNAMSGQLEGCYRADIDEALKEGLKEGLKEEQAYSGGSLCDGCGEKTCLSCNPPKFLVDKRGNHYLNLSAKVESDSLKKE